MPASVTLGTMSGSSITHSSQYVVTAVFNIPAGETPAAKDCVVTFTSPAIFYTKTGGFTVTSPPNTPPSIATQPASQTVSVGETVTFTVAASGSPTLAYHWQKNHVDIDGALASSYAIVGVATANAGDYRCVVTNAYGTATSDDATLTVDTSVQVAKASFPVVDTAQATCYNASTSMT